MGYLEPYSALPTKTRVGVDRNRLTGGGVTAGIDFALTLVSHLADRETAEMIQLRLVYSPAPFSAGSPDTAPPEAIARLRQMNPSGQERRRANNAAAAAALHAHV